MTFLKESIYRKSCSLFARDRLSLDVSMPKISQLLDSQAPELLALCSRQVGKTTSAAARVTHHAIFHSDTLSLIVSATQRQAGILQHRVITFLRKLNRSETWQEVPGQSAYVPEYIGRNAKLVRCSTLSLELANGSQVISAPASPDTIRGYSPHVIIIDEAAYTPDAVYQAVRPMRMRTKAQILAMSSAGATQGWYWQAWTEADSGWAKIEVLSSECPWIAQSELDRERRSLPAKIYEREYCNRFLEPGAAALSPELIKDLFDTDVESMDDQMSAADRTRAYAERGPQFSVEGET